VALADPRDLALGPLACAALGLQAAFDLLRATLELPDARAQLLFGPPQAGALGRCALLGLGELAAQLLDAAGQLAGFALGAADPRGQLIGALAAVVLEAGEPALGLHAQLLLGVLALLDPPQLALALGAVRALCLEQLGYTAPFLLGLAQSLLQGRHVALECLDRRFRGLGPALERGLTAIGRAPRASFGEEIGVADPAVTLAPAGCLALLDHALRSRYCARRTAPRVRGTDLVSVREDYSRGMSGDPDERDWRLSCDLGAAAGGGRLHGLVAGRHEAHAADDAQHAVGSDVVVTHDGSRVFAYAASREAIEDARDKLQAALARDGIDTALALSTWSDEHDAWIDPDAPPPRSSAQAADAQSPETRTYVLTLGRWVREEVEQSLSSWAAKLGVSCEIVEHPHLLSSQAAFTVTGPAEKLDRFAAAMKAEERATIRTETAVMSSPL
jgi:hypothetical protein